MDVSEQRKAGLSPAKLALLEKRLRGESGGQEGAQAAPERLPRLVADPERRFEPFPTTALQRQMRLALEEGRGLEGLAPYLFFETEKKGLDLEVFERSFRELLARHDVLRLEVSCAESQRCLPEPRGGEIAVLDLEGLPALEQEERLTELRRHFSSAPASAGVGGSLLEIRAVRLDGERTRLFLGFSLLGFDLPSLEFLVQQWRWLYEHPGQEPLWLAATFRDYQLAAMAFETHSLARRSQEYWRERLPALADPPALAPGVDPLRLSAARSVRLSSVLPRQVWLGLREQAVAAGLTPSSLLLSCLAEVIAAQTGQERMSFGSTLFARLPLAPEINTLLGPLATLVLSEVDNRGGGSFLERAKRHQAQLWKDLEHAHAHVPTVNRELGGAGWAGGTAWPPVVFTSALAHFDEAGDVPPSGWLGERHTVLHQGPGKGLELQALLDDGQLMLSWDVVVDWLGLSSARNLAADFEMLLTALSVGPGHWQRQWNSPLPLGGSA